jgi:manganese/zinc/iron transport system permease protein
MSAPDWSRLLSLDLPALLSGSALALAGSSAGTLLVLRRQGLFADGLSHAVLPGVVLAYLWSGSRAPGALLAGGLCAGLLLAAATRATARRVPLDPSAVLGALYPLFFALGLLLLESQSGGDLDLAPSHVLFGQLEQLAWRAPEDLAGWLDPASYRRLPWLFWQSFLLSFASLLWLALAGRALFVAGFDPVGARLLGLRPALFESVTLVACAAIAVGLFQVGGVVLALTLLLVPAACARLLTDRYRVQFRLAALLGIALVWAGYGLAVFLLPALLGTQSLSAAGGIASSGGALLLLLSRVGPRRARR